MEIKKIKKIKKNKGQNILKYYFFPFNDSKCDF